MSKSVKLDEIYEKIDNYLPFYVEKEDYDTAKTLAYFGVNFNKKIPTNDFEKEYLEFQALKGDIQRIYNQISKDYAGYTIDYQVIDEHNNDKTITTSVSDFFDKAISKLTKDAAYVRKDVVKREKAENMVF